MPAVPLFTTGSLALDVMLGGGWPGNQWNEILGAESSGKTTIAHKTIAANQQLDENFTTFWVAAEAYDHAWAETLGVDVERVIVYSTNAMEDAYTAMIQAAESRAVDAIVLDSYPALVPDDEYEKDMDQATISAGARVTGKFFRKVGSATRRSLVEQERPVLALIVNQFRDQIGGWSPAGMTPKTSPGGKARLYAYYTRLEVTRTEWIDEKRPGGGKTRVGQVIKLKTLKSKSAAPQQVASLKFYFADSVQGFRKGEYDSASQLVTMGILHGLIVADGSWYKYGGHRWHGEPKMTAAMRENLDLQEQLSADVMAQIHDGDS
ncbi:recombinase A [Streptomyces malaysiensis]|uniref:Protein RecA n=2 Tax=Streptomyces malaysiensis TaxID=92644 RepID=A0A7X5X7H2_STRMQ|nr:recombinase A [Streptomyces malaysiensis]